MTICMATEEMGVASNEGCVISSIEPSGSITIALVKTMRPKSMEPTGYLLLTVNLSF
jgi:hypothetical protein